MGEESINPDFMLSPFYNLKPLTKEEILKILENNNFIFRNFKQYGIIHSRQYPFITKITFSPHEKNEEEKSQAKENIKIIEDYFNSFGQDEIAPLRIDFAERKDNECALYNINRFNYNKIQEKLKEIFD